MAVNAFTIESERTLAPRGRDHGSRRGCGDPRPRAFVCRGYCTGEDGGFSLQL
jgi:hypothetical protein